MGMEIIAIIIFILEGILSFTNHDFMECLKILAAVQPAKQWHMADRWPQSPWKTARFLRLERVLNQMFGSNEEANGGIENVSSY